MTASQKIDQLIAEIPDWRRKTFAGIRKDVVAIPLGQGHTAFGRYAKDLGANAYQLLPADPRGRARVRALGMIVACDAHPLIVPRIRTYLEREMHEDEAARNRWLQHWTLKAVEALEAHLAKERETARFCHGDTPTMADLCLASQVFAAGYFDTPLTRAPTVKRIFDECMKIDAFDRAQPLKQPDAPKNPTH